MEYRARALVAPSRSGDCTLDPVPVPIVTSDSTSGPTLIISRSRSASSRSGSPTSGRHGVRSVLRDGRLRQRQAVAGLERWRNGHAHTHNDKCVGVVELPAGSPVYLVGISLLLRRARDGGRRTGGCPAPVPGSRPDGEGTGPSARPDCELADLLNKKQETGGGESMRGSILYLGSVARRAARQGVLHGGSTPQGGTAGAGSSGSQLCPIPQVSTEACRAASCWQGHGHKPPHQDPDHELLRDGWQPVCDLEGSLQCEWGGGDRWGILGSSASFLRVDALAGELAVGPRQPVFASLKRSGCCERCLSAAHMTEDCALPGDEDPDVAKRLKAIEAAVMALTQQGGPSGSTSTQRTASVAEVCRKFNFSECKFKACQFAHRCATCRGPHPAVGPCGTFTGNWIANASSRIFPVSSASQCPKSPTNPAEQGANAAPLGPWRRGPQKAGPPY